MRLDSDQMKVLAGAIGDSPYTVIRADYLRRSVCKAWVLGRPEASEAAVIQWDDQPKEPEGYGDPEGVWRLLRGVPGWDCVDVMAESAGPLAAAIERDTGRPCKLYKDLVHVLRRPAASLTHPDVRPLGPADVEFVNRAMPRELEEPADFAARASWAIAAGAVVDGRVVAYARTTARTGTFANIAVKTLKAYRRRGYCSAAASLVARAVQAAGETPVWSCGETNAASARVAEKLGFEYVGHKTYVIASRP